MTKALTASQMAKRRWRKTTGPARAAHIAKMNRARAEKRQAEKAGAK